MAKFLPPDYDQFLFQQYQTLVKMQKSVAEYTTNFLRLSSRKSDGDHRAAGCERYLHGLKPTICDKIGCQVILTLSEAQNMAQRAESIGFLRYGREETRKNMVEPSRENPKPNVENIQNLRKRVAIEKESPEKLVNNPCAKATGDKCYKCSEVRHQSNNCPQQRVVNVVDYDANDYEEEEEEGVCEPDGDEDNVQQTFML